MGTAQERGSANRMRCLFVASALFGTACTGVLENGQAEGTADRGTPAGTAAAGSGSVASGGASSSAAARPTCTPIPQRIWRLTPEQIQNTWTQTLGVDAIDPRLAITLQPLAPKTGMFGNTEHLLSMSTGFVEQLFSNARSAAQTDALGRLDACVAGGANRACAEQVITQVGASAFRHRLSAEETTELLSFYDSNAKAADGRAALELTLRRILGSPNTLFRTELGTPSDGGKFQLTGPELASALAFFVSNGPPDAELAEKAANGALAQPEVVRGQVERLLSTPKSAGGLWAFFKDYLRLTHPAHPDQPEEARRFIEEALWHGDASLQTLLTAPYTFVDPALATLYWSDASVASTWQKVTPPDGRTGALTLGGVLSSATNRSARGKFVREHFLCSAPIVVPTNIPSLEQGTSDFVAQNGRQPTRRELLAMHTSRPGCASCHSLIDPLGQPFEGFGVDGAARALDAGGDPVVTNSVITATGDLDGPVSGFLELEQKLAASAQVQHCFVQRLYSYAYGFQAAEADACYVDQLTERFTASHGNIRALVADIVVAKSFGERSAMQP